MSVVSRLTRVARAAHELSGTRTSCLHASSWVSAAPQSTDHDPAGRAPPPPRRQACDALVPVPPSPLQRTIASAVNGLHRLVMLLSSMRHTSATTQYVSSYLQRQGIDSFTLEYLQITRPFVLRLSVARDIEPVLSWLRSVGCGGDKLVDLVRHAPGILSASVDDYLEPLAALVQEAGGRPQDVLGMCCPGIFEVPVGQLAAARLVLQHMGASEGAVSQLLLRAPDVYVQLTQALMHLFPDWMQQQQMSPWNSSKWMAAPGSSSSNSSGTVHGAAACPPDFLLQAERLHGCQVHRCLLQVLAALDAFKPQGAVEWDAAAAETAAADVQHAIDELDRALLDEQHAAAHVVCA